MPYSEYTKRLEKLSLNKDNVQSNVAFIKAIGHIKRLESKQTGVIEEGVFFDENGDMWKVTGRFTNTIVLTRVSLV